MTAQSAMVWPHVTETPRAMQAVERDDFADEPRVAAPEARAVLILRAGPVGAPAEEGALLRAAA